MDNLSEKEQELLDLITTSTEKVTVKLIEEKLGAKYVGALGRLIGRDLIESKKERIENADESSPYLRRIIKYYTIKEKKNEEVENK